MSTNVSSIICAKCGHRITKKNDLFVLQYGMFHLEVLCGTCFGERTKQLFIGLWRTRTPINSHAIRMLLIMLGIASPVIIFLVFVTVGHQSQPLAIVGTAGFCWSYLFSAWQHKKAMDMEKTLE